MNLAGEILNSWLKFSKLKWSARRLMAYIQKEILWHKCARDIVMIILHINYECCRLNRFNFKYLQQQMTIVKEGKIIELQQWYPSQAFHINYYIYRMNGMNAVVKTCYMHCHTNIFWFYSFRNVFFHSFSWQIFRFNYWKKNCTRFFTL